MSFEVLSESKRQKKREILEKVSGFKESSLLRLGWAASFSFDALIFWSLSSFIALINYVLTEAYSEPSQHLRWSDLRI